MEIRFLDNSNNVVINFLRRAKYSVWLLFVAVGLCALDIHAQNTDYISPLDIPLDFAGNFGELRSGHFHMGLDMRTQGREEHVVKSIADGYVSRISINTKGYGQALYINHPDGNTSVYAHLSDFSGSIKDWTRKVQYAKKTYTLDTLLPEGLLPVSGGQQIGSSGNSGGSSGPHLHFEIRNTKTERAINPMYFGFKPVRDNTPPELLLLAIYPLSEVSFVNGKQQPAYLPLKKKDGKYQLETAPAVYGKIGFGIYCRDRIDGSSFSFAVHSVQLLKKNVVVYAHRIDSIAFNQSRFVNAHIDYPEAIRSKRKIQKSYLSDFNELDIYAGVVNGGKFFFTGDTSTPMRYEVKDFNGNLSILDFTVGAQMPLQPKTFFEPGLPLRPTDSLSYCLPDTSLCVLVEAGSVYDPILLNIKRRKENSIWPLGIFDIGTLEIPLQKFVTLSFNALRFDEELRSKLTVISLDKNEKILAAEPTTLEGDWIVCRTRSLGPYTLLPDTTGPVIGNTIGKSQRFIDVKVSDNLSGIARYNCWLGNTWVLTEYHPNMKKIRIITEQLPANSIGKSLRLVLTDAAGNQTEKNIGFYK